MESPVFLESTVFSHQRLFYLLKVPNCWVFLLLLSQKFCLTVLLPELWHCVCHFNWNFCLLAGQCPALHMHTTLLPVPFPLLSSWTLFWVGVYNCVSLHPSSFPATWFPKKKLNYFLHYQTCLKSSAMHVSINTFFWITYVEMYLIVYVILHFTTKF